MPRTLWRCRVGFALVLGLLLGLTGIGRTEDAHNQASRTGHSVADTLRAMDDRLWGNKYNFAIPDAPAFELLSVEASTILRPQTAQDLRLAFSKFEMTGGSLSLPRALAVEFSPLLLTNAGAAKQTARKHPVLSGTRLSVAMDRDARTRTATRFAVGVRLPIVDQRSFARTDVAFPESLRVTRYLEQILAMRSKANERAIIAARDKARAEGREFDPSTVETGLLMAPGEDAALVDSVKTRLEKRYWNATSIELAFALRGSSRDSLGHGPRLDAMSVWASYALGVGTWGQMLVGARGGGARDSLTGDLVGEGSTAGRFYYGSARMKVFAEGQLTGHKGNRTRYLFDAGLEAALREWLWLEFSLGAEKSGGGPAGTVSSFKIRTGIPGTG